MIEDDLRVGRLRRKHRRPLHLVRIELQVERQTALPERLQSGEERRIGHEIRHAVRKLRLRMAVHDLPDAAQDRILRMPVQPGREIGRCQILVGDNDD
jgi:hypothetical protein